MDLASEGPSHPIEIGRFWVTEVLLLFGCGWTDFEGTLATFEIALALQFPSAQSFLSKN